MNYYIEKFSPLITSCETQQDYIKVYNRIAANIASIILGLGVNESLEEFLADKPAKNEFFIWWREIRSELHMKAFNKPFTPAI